MKKILGLMLLCWMVVSLVSCDSKKSSDNTDEKSGCVKDETFWNTVDALNDIYLLKYSELVSEISDADNSDYHRESCIIELDALIGSRTYMPIYRENENFYYVVREIEKNVFADRMRIYFNATLKVEEHWLN